MGEPTERDRKKGGEGKGGAVDEERRSSERQSEHDIDRERKRMMKVHRGVDGDVIAICKGAPESLLHPGVLADEPVHIDAAVRLSHTMAATGGRVIAVAHRRGTADEATTMSESGLSLLGLVKLQDPLSPSSVQTITACHEAGIDVALVTGDHPATAASIAALVGIEPGAEHVMARATPSDKLALIQGWQE